ncbi:MAG: hypothetical protein ACP5VF_11870 [Acidobacteriota bacterium]
MAVHWFRRGFFAALVAALLTAALPLLAQSGSDEVVQFRIQGEQDKAVIEMPLKVLQFLDQHKVEKGLQGCRVEGQQVTLDLGKVLDALKKESKGGESQLFAVEKHGRKSSVTVGFAPSAQPRPGKAPTNFVLRARNKGEGGEETRISVPLSTVQSLLSGIKVEGKGPVDTEALFAQLVPFAKQLGTGLLARVVSNDGEVTLSLE